MIELGYVGNIGRHQVIPVPFNQPLIANPTAPVHSQTYSYGYTVSTYDESGNVVPIHLPNGKPYLQDYEGGNVDHRVPYIGWAAESISYRAAGVDAYNALTSHVEKRMSHGIQVAASYTYSHALDEQSGLGLFYNGNNPLNLRGGYASADFDRTHVINFNYVFQMPDLIREHSLASYFANGWSLVGLTVLQSGQPYSVIDFSGAVGSIYYSTANGITNPIVPLVNGCTAQSAKTGKSGAFGDEALRSDCFGIPLVAPGAYNGGIPSNDPYETNFTTGQRNIFRQAFQRRADASIVKMTKFNERYSLKYTFDIYNLTNTSSFDVPGNEVSQNEFYDEAPQEGTPPSEFYNAPYGLGVVGHTIGSARQVQMSLQLTF
jgi:hypothetical protein